MREPSVKWIAPSVFLQWVLFLGQTAFVIRGLSEQFGKPHAALIWSACVTMDGTIAFVVSPMLGALSDRFGRKPLQAYAVLMQLPLQIGLAAGMWHVLPVFFFLRALGGSPFWGAQTYSADLADGSEKQVKMQALMALSIAPANTFGPLAVDAIFRAFGDQKAWIILAGLPILNGTYVLVCVPESLKTRQLRAQTSLNPFRHFRLLCSSSELGANVRQLRCAAAALLFLYAGKVGALQLLMPYVDMRFQWSAEKGSFVLSLWGIIQTTSNALLVALSRCWKPSERSVAQFGILAGFVGFFLITVGFYPPLFLVGNAIGAVSILSLGALASYAARLGARRTRTPSSNGFSID